jgi:proteic killer suppression protein
VEIDFSDKRLEQECNHHRLLVRRFGERAARVLRRRLDDLDSAETLEDMRSLPGRCHELVGDRAGQLSIDLVHPMRLIFVPTEPCRRPDGGIDWTAVKAITIQGVEDTHE